MSTGPAPTVSVCIPTYMGASYIAQALDSVLDQSFTDFEIVVSDDASTDATLQILSGYDDPRLRVLPNSVNAGASANWNRALAAARGRYVKLLCHDDYLYPGALERQVAGFGEPGSGGVVLVTSPRDIVDDDGTRLMTRGLDVPGRMCGDDVRRRIVRSGTNVLGETSSALFRTDAARAAGGFDTSSFYTLDVEFWMRLLQEGDLFVVGETLSAYRVHLASWSVALASGQAADFAAMVRRFAAEEDSGISRSDVAVGAAMARINAIGRRVVYSLMRRGVLGGS
ncbi:MAG: glycosyltransferase [Coriobacteriia bacterium]|nr:glycosyltransferase [Coriobacteriia bacterium]